ncbi:MAG: hypothetical protein KKA54_08590 [Proteobacteria bacterium]|nr:hypothetical protein [Pseudomonadota bacterium]
MIKTLLSLDENLASSIALRYAFHQANLIPAMKLQAIHVEEPDNNKKHSAGSGWVRRTWEKGMEAAGADEVNRLLKTENVSCTFVGPPKVFVGDRQDEILEELVIGGYDMYMEGDLNTSVVADFNNLITSDLYRKSPCPMMIVKNLITSNCAGLLCGDGVDHQKLITNYLKVFKNSGLELDLLYYKFQENDEVIFQDKEEAGSILIEAEKTLEAAGMHARRSQVISGSPERVGDYLRNYFLVASTFPSRKGPRLELLAHVLAPVFLCRQ